jgi:histidinol-phosphate aminotransferase
MTAYFQPHIERMDAYVPGEQPREGGFIKLNTNENPYPPSPRVVEAIQSALSDRLRLYPDPVASRFRRVAATLHAVAPDMIMAGNGSDDLLTIITRAFAGPGDIVVYPMPSYILYRTLIELQNARPVEVPFEPDWSLRPERFAPVGVRLAFLANPNSPSGTALSPAQVAALAERLPCPLVVDEAYVDFADSHCVDLVHEHRNVIVTRSLSKGYSLAGLRFGYLVAQPDIVAGLNKVKDSYNCDTLSQVAASAALDDQQYLAQTRQKVLATRARLTDAARRLGYLVPESQANFIWCVGGPPARRIYEALKERKILVRLMCYPDHPEGLRISVGIDNEVDRLLEELRKLV